MKAYEDDARAGIMIGIIVGACMWTVIVLGIWAGFCR
jgi:hypothetical protein